MWILSLWGDAPGATEWSAKMKLRIYLDTSFNAYYDTQVSERQSAIREFWTQLGNFEVTTSDVT